MSRGVLPIVIEERQRGRLGPPDLSNDGKKREERDSKTRGIRKPGKQFVFCQSVHRINGAPETTQQKDPTSREETRGDSEPAASNVTVWVSVDGRGGRCIIFSYVRIKLYCSHDRR